MGFTVGAQAPLDRFLILQIWVLEGVAVVRSTQHILFEFHGVDDVVPESGVPTLGLVLMIAHK